MKKGDLVVYNTDDVSDGLLVDPCPMWLGLVIATDPIWNGNEISPGRIEVLWHTGEIGKVFEDEVEVVNV